MADNDMSVISGDFLRIDDEPKVYADEDNPADVTSDANATGDVMAGDPFRGVQPDTSMDFGGVPDDQDSVRSAEGHTSFLNGILHEAGHANRHKGLPPEIAAGIPQRRRHVGTDSHSRAADRMRTATFTLAITPNGQRVLPERTTRRRTVITNWDTTGPIYVSASQSVAIGSPDAVRVPQAASATVPSSRDFYTQEEIWVAGNTGATFDVLDEYDDMA